jgi:hypothetical protein
VRRHNDAVGATLLGSGASVASVCLCGDPVQWRLDENEVIS